MLSEQPLNTNVEAISLELGALFRLWRAGDGHKDALQLFVERSTIVFLVNPVSGK